MVKNRIIARGLRALMDTAPWSMERLQPFAGQTVLLKAGSRSFPFVIAADGALEPRHEATEAPALTLDIAPEAWSRVLLGQDTLLHHLHISGNSALAVEMGFLAKHFRPDFEELLSHWVGDMAAHRLGGLWRHGHAWIQDTLRRQASMVHEYVTEEAALLPTRASMARFSVQLKGLDDELAQLEQRLSRLR